MANNPPPAYRLLARTTERGVTAYRALDSAGRRVMVHFLEPARHREHRRMLALLEELDAADRACVIESAELDDCTLVVTETLEGFSTLASWLEARALTAAAAQEGAEAETPDTFERLFGPSVESDETAAAGPQREDAPGGESGPKRSEEGLGSTRPTMPEPGARQPEPELEEREAEREDREDRDGPDTFEELFGPGSEPRDGKADEAERGSPPDSLPPEPSGEGSEAPTGTPEKDTFERLFEPLPEARDEPPVGPDTSLGPTKPSLDSVGTASPEAAELPSQQQESDRSPGPGTRTTSPGEFTRLFGRVDAPPESEVPQRKQPAQRRAPKRPQERDTEDILEALSSSEDEGSGGARRGEAPAAVPPPIQPPVSVPAYSQPAVAAESSEYARVVEGARPAAPEPAAGDAQRGRQAGAEPQSPKRGPLLLALGAIILAAVALVIVFALI